MFMKTIDKLPTGPEWTCKLVRVQGDLEPTEEEPVDENPNAKELELWLHNPVTCIRELIGNPSFHGEIAYALEKVYLDCQGRTCHYDEMWTGDWWWRTQVSNLKLESME